jgi:large subunit ribosomal protein L30
MAMSDKSKGRVRVTQVRAAHKRTKDQQATLIGLGLGKMNRTRELADTPAVRGMIAKVRHLVTVETAKAK